MLKVQKRHRTHAVKVGHVTVGGGAPSGGPATLDRASQSANAPPATTAPAT